MKTMRKLMTVLLTFVMVLGLGVTAGAAETTAPAGTYTITINSERTGHTYEAYQIFKGDLSTNADGKKVLSNIEWGEGVNGTTLLAALNGANVPDAFKDDKGENIFANAKTAADVAEALAKHSVKDDSVKDDSELAQKFADVVGANLSNTTSGTCTENKNKVDGKTTNYTISGLVAGYYLVKDKDGNIPEQDAYIRFILQVVGDAEVNAKSEVPTIDKKILDPNDETKVDTNEASIGDTVKYELTSKVPDMTGYEKYYFIIHDTLSKGLTYPNDATVADLVVKIGDTELDATNGYTATATPVTDKDGNETGKTELKIVFKNFIQYQESNPGADIVVTYNAVLNKDAVIGGTVGNPNTVKLEYSNDPNYDYNGTDEPKPGDNEPTGETPEQKVETFTTELTIIKHDENDLMLTGAEFELTGEGVKTVLVTEDQFTENVNGIWYKLKNGTYTEAEPTTGENSNEDKYESPIKKYDRKQAIVVKNEDKTATSVTGIVDNKDGKLTFTGLGAGTYTLKETKAPEGYNRMEDITFTISFDNADGKTDFSIESVTPTGTTFDKTNNTFSITIKNLPGSVLPGTGGIGTTIFYIAGTILVLAAAVLLITKRRMAQK